MGERFSRRDLVRWSLMGAGAAPLLAAACSGRDGAAPAASSSTGASAVLLKMDEYQGRIGTPGALVRKGTKAEAAVPMPTPVPV